MCLLYAQAGTLGGSPEVLIKAIYANHQPWAHHEIALDREDELSKYFDKELTELFLKEEGCKKATHEICRLEADPIYCQQDFADELKNLRVVPIRKQSNKYTVSFVNLEKRRLVYSMNKTRVGWRVSDIQCEEGPSLKQQLSRPAD